MEIVSTHDNFIMYHSLRDGDLVETGEKPILADVSSYKNFFASCESIVNIQKKSPNMSWGSGSYRMCKQEAEELGISSETFLHIQVLDANLHRFKNCEVEDKALERQAVLQKTISERLGTETVKPIKLSSLIDKGQAMCSEFSILAQSYLESHGIDSYLCDAHLFQETSGGILYEAHHFLAVHDKDSMFIYDPLNTKKTGRPRVMNTGMTKEQFMQKAINSEKFILDFPADIKKLNSVFDIGDTHHLGYGYINRRTVRNR